MNFKNSARSISLVLLTVSIIAVTSVHHDVFASDAGMSLTAITEQGSDILNLTGKTMSPCSIRSMDTGMCMQNTFDQGDVTIRVISPNGSNIVGVDQLTPDANGEFSTEFNVSNWKQDGMYKIKAKSLLYSVTVNVEVIGGMTTETSPTESGIGMSDGLVQSQLGGKVMNSDACALKNPPRWDKTAEVNEKFTITWDNPNRNICTYDVMMFDQNKFRINITTGQWTDRIDEIGITQNFAGQSYFKICSNEIISYCTEFIDVNVIDTAMNNTMIVMVAAIVAVIGISGGIIYRKTNQSKSILTSKEEENITDIDKQIAINEEKLRKIEEESKRLDEEN